MSELLEAAIGWLRGAGVSPWLLCQALAAAAASWSMRAERARLLLALPFGVAGAHALGFVYRVPGWLEGKHDPFGVAAWGALVGTAFGFALLAQRAGHEPRAALDRVSPALALLVVFGRLGCLFAGCDAGRVSLAPWAVRFPRATAVFEEHVARGLVLPSDTSSLAVHPSQLYEALGALAVWIVLRRRPSIHGFVIGYAAIRLLAELTREGPRAEAALVTSAVMLVLALGSARRAQSAGKIDTKNTTVSETNTSAEKQPHPSGAPTATPLL